MNSIKFFWKQDCPKCPAAKQIFDGLKKWGFRAVEYNMETAEGLAEGTYHSVLSTPTLLVIDEEDREILQWRGDIPTLEEIKAVLANNSVERKNYC